MKAATPSPNDTPESLGRILTASLKADNASPKRCCSIAVVPARARAAASCPRASHGMDATRMIAAFAMNRVDVTATRGLQEWAPAEIAGNAPRTLIGLAACPARSLQKSALWLPLTRSRRTGQTMGVVIGSEGGSRQAKIIIADAAITCVIRHGHVPIAARMGTLARRPPRHLRRRLAAVLQEDV